MNTQLDISQQEYWWSINLVTKEYLCSEPLLKMCGITSGGLTESDFMLLVHPSQQSDVRDKIGQFRATGIFNEQFKLSTKFGYRWVISSCNSFSRNDIGEELLMGYLNFQSESDILLATDQSTQQRLNKLIKRYTLVSSSLMGMLHLSEDAINSVLKNLLDEFNGDRVYIFSYNFERQTQHCVYKVLGDEVRDEKDHLQEIPLSSTKWWTHELLECKRSIVCNDIATLRDVAMSEYEILDKQDIKSIMVAPMVNKDGVCGYMGIDIVNKYHSWSAIDRQWFISLSSMISLCIELKKSEKKSQSEQEHYRSLYENMPICFLRMKLIYDNRGRAIDYLFVEMNSIARRLLCSGSDQKIRKLGSEINPNDLESHMNTMSRISINKQVFKSEEPICVDDKYFETTMYAADQDEIIILMQDNTETIQTSRALHKSEETLQNIYKNIPVGIEIYDKNGNLLSINDMEQKIFGYKTKEEMLRINLFTNTIVPPTFLEDLRSEKPSWCDFYYNFDKHNEYHSTSHQEPKHIVLKGTILYDSDHKIENYLLIMLDNTDTLQANHKILEFESLFNSIAEFSEMGLCQWNPCDKTIFGTDQWYYNLNQQKAQFTEITDAYSNAHPDDQIVIFAGFQQMISGEITSFSKEIRIREADGWKWLRGNYKVSQYRPQDNNIEIIAIDIDITDLKNTEIALTKAKIKAEESDKLKSAFLANMSHEIRTPLNAIVGFSDLLTESDTTSEREQYIKIIKHNSDLLLQLISDILDISKIEAGIVEVMDESIDVTQVCSDVLVACRNSAKPNVQLTLDAPAGSCMINADKNRLTQVLNNLVYNATKFTSVGSITLGYHIKNELIYFYVRDTGIGIEKSQLENVFKRFVKINTFISGTGLGLAICRSLVEKMGGHIWLESEIGQGSCFRFSLPYTSEQTRELDSSCSTSPMENMVVITPDQTDKKATILIAEDTDSNYLLVSAILHKEYNLIRALNGIQAIEMFKIHHPKLILMDIKMPEMDGLEATRHIRKIDSAVPIIVLTAFAFDNDKTLAIEAGSNEFMTKPVHPKSLKDTIKSYIG